MPQVSGDRVQLQQVMVNLLTNACDAMDGAEGDRRLTLQTSKIDDGVKVSVVDRGRGIPAEDLERIFQPFVSTKTEGMGLGLAVCRTIIIIAPGETLGHQQPGLRSKPALHVAREHRGRVMNSGAPTVYLVDDDASVLTALTRLLTSAGVKSAAFDSPEAFLESLDAATAGCLVLDVSMPGVNGLELQQALIAKGCDLPIIFLTGVGDIPTSVRAMKHGAAGLPHQARRR